MDAKLKSGLALSPEQISDFSLFNDVQLEVKKCFLSRTPIDLVETALVAFEEQISPIFAQLHEQMQFQPETPLKVRATQVMFGTYGNLQAAFSDLRAALQKDREQACWDHLSRARQSLASLQQTMAELRTEEEARPNFCDIPLYNDICRVALLVVGHKLPQAALQTRLEQSWELYDRLKAIVEEHYEPPQEGSGQGPLTGALGQVKAGLELFEGVLQSLPQVSRDALEEATDLLGDGSATLVEHYLKAKEPAPEAAPPTVACLRCSQANPAGAKRCSRCNALFPVSIEGTAGPSINLDETGRTREWPSFIARLVSQVEAFRGRRSTPEHALQEIEDLRNRLEQGLQKMGEIEVVEGEGVPAEQLQLFTEVFASLEASVERALASLESMSNHIGKTNPIGVDRDLDDFLTHIEQLVDLQRQMGAHLAAAKQEGAQ